MARKTKSNVLFDQQKITIDEISTRNVNATISTDFLKSMPGQESKLTYENKEKLEMFVTIQAENSDLHKQNAILTDKVAEYILELSTLRIENEHVTSLTTQLEQLSNDIAVKNDELNQYLLRISELTFENANLRSQIQSANIQNKSLQTKISNPIKCNSYPLNKYVNGYESWN